MDPEPGTEFAVQHTAAPPEVCPVPRLANDLEALDELFHPDLPPLRPIHPAAVTTVIYGFADASGVGFGSSLQLPSGSVAYRYGLWGKDA
jgi:hypothetical protein